MGGIPMQSRARADIMLGFNTKLRTSLTRRQCSAGTCLVWLVLAVSHFALVAAVLDGSSDLTGSTNHLAEVTSPEELDPLRGWQDGSSAPVLRDEEARPTADSQVRLAELRVFWTDPILAGGLVGIVVLAVSAIALSFKSRRRA